MSTSVEADRVDSTPSALRHLLYRRGVSGGMARRNVGHGGRNENIAGRESGVVGVCEESVEIHGFSVD